MEPAQTIHIATTGEQQTNTERNNNRDQVRKSNYNLDIQETAKK